VAEIVVREGRVQGVKLASGEELSSDAVLSTAGLPETIRLSGWEANMERYTGRMSFMETISFLSNVEHGALKKDRTIIFYHNGQELRYQRPETLLDPSWGVICFPDNFVGQPASDLLQIRVTNAANYALWKALAPEAYGPMKQRWTAAAVKASEEIIGNYQHSIVYQDSFTPVTIERFTRKAQGAVYGSAVKIKDGLTPWPNLFIAGTDQGYLGIVGAMLSGITVVNLHLLQ
jgi:phytoene dehydrogenase-like protein